VKIQENQWFYMKNMGKYLRVETVLTHECMVDQLIVVLSWMITGD
jgi:hypothetical protein